MSFLPILLAYSVITCTANISLALFIVITMCVTNFEIDSTWSTIHVRIRQVLAILVGLMTAVFAATSHIDVIKPVLLLSTIDYRRPTHRGKWRQDIQKQAKETSTKLHI